MQIEAGKAVNAILYIVLIGFFIFALYHENRDAFSSKQAGGNAQWGLGHGASYATGKPHSDDSVSALLDKIRITSRYEKNSIMWRRCFIIATIGSFLTFYLTQKRIPSGTEFAIGFFLIYIISYMVLTSIQKMTTDFALKQLDDIVRQIRHKISVESP